MIEDEGDEEVTVEGKSYHRLMIMGGGWLPFIGVNLSMFCFIFCSIAGDYITQQWAYAPAEKQQSRFKWYCCVVFGLALATVLFIILRVMGLLFMSLRTAKIAHNDVLKLVFQAPINTFFDVTPIGKILNRFSKDIQVLDNSLCFNVGSFFACIYQTLAALIVATLAVRWILIVVVIVFFLGICLFKYALKGYKECNRIESVSKSPMLSFLQETQTGLTVIRAFGQ